MCLFHFLGQFYLILLFLYRYCIVLVIYIIMDKPVIAKPITVSFDGANYVLWAQEMSSFLLGRKLWRYVIGDIVEPKKKSK